MSGAGAADRSTKKILLLPAAPAPDIHPSSLANMSDQTNQPQNYLLRAAANLFPGYFALVMATGIISIAAFLLEMKILSLVLLVINVIAYVILWLFLLLRLTLFFPRIRADISD